MGDISDIIYQKAFMQSVLRSLPCALLAVDEKGHVTDLNHASQRLFGAKAGTRHGKGLGSFLSCLHAREHDNGCGHAGNCRLCHTHKLARSALLKNRPQKATVRLESLIDGELRDVALVLTALPNQLNGKKFCLIIIENLSSPLPRYEVDDENGFQGIVGRSPKMLDVFDTIAQISPSNDPVLIQGESGTGKELVALAIHRQSARVGKHFVPVNCGALPEGLLESEMFGHIKGAFTGATYNKKGRFRVADGGTIFLDEIGEMSPAMQAKFLRVLESGYYEPVGSDKPVHVDVRVISATNRIIGNEIEEGHFRQDLYYRLCVIPIMLPALRERQGDILLLADHFLKRYGAENHLNTYKLSKAAASLLENYSWPGNVRELQNVLKHAVVKCRSGSITPEHFPHYLFQEPVKGIIQRRRKSKLQSDAVADALRQAKGNKRWAAEILGVSRSTLYRYFERRENDRLKT